jgi:(2Fe-2S) ferredoxin
VYRLSKAAGLDKVRRQIITSVADVMVYKSDYWGHQIRNMVAEKLEPYIGTGDAVTIVAHSLGSVVSFDTIYYNATANPTWKAAGFRPTNLFTMGSPLALFSLDLDRETGEQPVRYAPGPTPETPDIPDSPALHVLRPEGVWYNFLDAQDIIAYPLGLLFEGNFPVEDVVVQTGTNPRKAHDGYWENNEVAEVIAGRLKMDFQRINTRGDGPVIEAPEAYAAQA